MMYKRDILISSTYSFGIVESVSNYIKNIKDLYTFSTLKKGFKDTYDHEFVPFHMCFDVESDLRKKS